MKVDIRPHKNKDGSDSKVRKDYVVIHRGRGGRYEVGVAKSQNAADEMIEQHRMELRARHMDQHPNDKQFMRKAI